MVATYREHAHALLRGIPMTKIMAEMFGKQEGCSRGRGGSMHLFDKGRRVLRRQRDRGRRPAGGGRLALADKRWTGSGSPHAISARAVAEGAFHGR